MSLNKESKKNKQVKESTALLDFVRVTGAIPALVWKRPKVYYVGDKQKSRPKGGVLFTSNHITFTDPILLYCAFWYRRLRFLATKDLYKNGLVSFLFSAAGCIQVDKDNFNMSSLHSVVDKLKEGKALLIFPEGQVNQKEQMLSFKSGAVLMAQLGGVPIQPVFIVRREKWYHRTPVLVGEPIDVKAMCSRFPSMEEMQKVTEYVYQQQKALEQYYINNIQKGD